MAETKQELQVADSPGLATPISEQDWTNHEETQARRKIDGSVLPLLYLGLLVFQLDRMNLASALTGGFAKDIGVDQDTINLGNQLMFLGIVILEIPSNMLLQQVGPRKYISAQVMLLGLVATLQIFLRDRKGFLASRMFLGLAEAGYIPGACYTLSTWYKKKELAKRVAVFFFVEGVFTIFVGLSLLLLLPGSPETPDPLLSRGLVRFKGSERAIIQCRLESDDKEKRHGVQGMHIPPKLVLKTILHWQRWPHFLSSFAVFSTWSPLTTYTPTIIMQVARDLGRGHYANRESCRNLGFNRI
ncbi:putative transporter [Colletotrichum aenigma]|uniref:putative transporter n=1 Tax=Colletotrichum aenigma TaxID=1215731 RepID=UPI0018729898|nr:putative transporter [Colletotrichum aenigma]KAF5502541.1 putative transporter [Colletotrichum aenigma]